METRFLSLASFVIGATSLTVEDTINLLLGESRFEMQQLFTGGRMPNVVVATDPAESVLMSDESQIYKTAGKAFTSHEIIAHIDEYVRDGYVHTNTIEGFWSLLKRAWYGQHHKYEVKFMPLYVAEACWKYNHRKMPDLFDVFIRGCFT